MENREEEETDCVERATPSAVDEACRLIAERRLAKRKANGDLGPVTQPTRWLARAAANARCEIDTLWKADPAYLLAGTAALVIAIEPLPSPAYRSFDAEPADVWDEVVEGNGQVVAVRRG